MLKLNIMLTNRGFKNTTTNFGMGKVNASWENNNIIVKRSKQGKKVIVTFANKANKLTQEFILGEDDDQKLKKYIITNF